MGPGSLEEQLEPAVKMLVSALAQLLSRGSGPHIKPPPDPAAQISMPRDVAHRLLMELYDPKPKEQDHRQFRIGAALGAVSMSLRIILGIERSYLS